ALDNGIAWGHAGAQAEARIRLADAAYRRNDAGRSLELLREAETNLSLLPDGVFAEGWRTDMEMMRAEALLGTSNRDAFDAIGRAFDIMERRQTPFRLARARWIRGRSVADSTPEQARAEFLQGLKASAAQPAAIDPFGRSLADQRWLLVKSLLSLGQADRAEPHDLSIALATLLADDRSDVLERLQNGHTSSHLTLVFVALDEGILRWQIRRDRVTRELLPVRRRDLERQINEHASLVRRQDSGDWLSASDRVSGLILSGIADSAPAALTVVADELLSQVTFATLRWPATKRFFDETTDLTVLAVGASPQRPRSAASIQRALVVGDPSTNSGNLFPSLPGAREEATQIASLYAAPTLLTGDEATRARLQAAIPNADIIHYAGHAVGDRVDPSASRLILVADDPGSAFTAAEVTKLPVNARVVVLAACQGALTASAGNVAIHGLASAFLKAGTRHVVASRWDVDDRYSTGFLRVIHQHLIAGAGVSRAVRSAQSALRTEPGFSHPYFWAGFSAYATIDSRYGDSNESE
ncbi:MAG TPA: CHAT domain-containing protein, partial [Vicinamibacterales bacterium]|nr:CHAT domain-containing protein [Vicinamibacterales bacterium]